MTADQEEGPWVQPRKVNLEDRFGPFDDLWGPKFIGAVRDSDLKLVKVRSKFVWQRHDDTNSGSGLVLGEEEGSEMAAGEGSCDQRDRGRKAASAGNAGLL
jgi:hypothetical protein